MLLVLPIASILAETIVSESLNFSKHESWYTFIIVLIIVHKIDFLY